MQAACDPSLKKRIETLPIAIEKSKAPTTVKKYMSGFKTWLHWVSACPQTVPLPADEIYLALFIQDQIDSKQTYGKVSRVFEGINWIHILFYSSLNPCNSYLIKSLLSYAKKMLSKPIVKKEPVTATHLRELLHIYGNPINSLKNLRLLAICFTAYAGFLRYDELSNLRFSDLKSYNDYVKIFIAKSKTDIYRQGFWVHIAETFKRTCPVAILSNYVRQANSQMIQTYSSSVLLFLRGNLKIIF